MAATDPVRPAPPPRWRLSGAALLWYEPDGGAGAEAIVYHSGSGGTHLLNAVAAEALRALEAGPADAAELARRLALASHLDAEDEWAGKLHALLVEFDELGLVEPCA